MAKTDFDVCIRGAGIVGRALALTLGQAKLRVALVDSVRPTPRIVERDIRAYALNHASKRLLESLRCWPEGSAITAVRRMQVHGDTNGSVLFEAPASAATLNNNQQTEPNHAQDHSDPLAWIVDVPALEDILAAALRFQSSVEIVRAPVAAPLTAICEGKHSSSRDGLGIGHHYYDYPQHAIATRIKAPFPHNGQAQQWFKGPHIVALLPLDGDSGNTFAVIWSTSFENADRLLTLSDEDFTHELEQITNHGKGVKGVVSPLFQAEPSPPLQVIGPRARWPLKLSQAQQWCGAMPVPSSLAGIPMNSSAAWVLVGDAAHTVHPLAGSGLNLGLADVEALSSALLQRPAWRAVNDLRLLRQYERERKTALQTYATATDGLQWLFWQEQPWLQTLRNWGMRSFSASGPFKHWVMRQAMNL
ncbi:ubiquinone biosynthesis protein UbiH [Lampropedia puyangensis]|uniref:Ubiquinone biosynthesis protein UbiH n=1 Tax=Lampropedia puyangensis TaxID=1330072 RepID=A0A4S8F9T4_9BURK|nr:FAD-dependent monooxygenase [Lampropedia puyangensis]THU03999.1 ubiquinone biosynthesis protein UbiH [Lampropedia puyangensis]